jgi:oligoendopeptidase F
MNGAWRPGVAFITATYDVGGIGNLAELLHETGHAVHISAIRTRPAFADWPDSDPFTEGIADVVALEMYEPTWQQRWLGDSVSMADSWSEKYSGIVFDIAWSLFEVRMHRNPEADPNVVWANITSHYLHIAPHPELSWWAMRGQLVDEPGYMANYAIGAIIIADLRARVRELHGSFTTGDSSWYAFLSDRVYRFGLARTSRAVIESFLGRPVTVDAILADMRRIREERH